MKLLGPSAFGPSKFRAMAAEGAEGACWQPLVNLVRIPELKGIRCTAESNAAEKTTAEEKSAERFPEKDCTLSGDKLFLIDAVSADPDFTNAVTVPDGLIDAALSVPLPKNKTLYIKLRDDPATEIQQCCRRSHRSPRDSHPAEGPASTPPGERDCPELNIPVRNWSVFCYQPP